MFNLNYKFLINKNKKVKNILCFIFVFLISLLYFSTLMYLNNGIMHLYFLLLIICGFLIAYNYTNK